MRAHFPMMAAAALVVSPAEAVARDRLPYVGVEGGAIKPNDVGLDYRLGALAVGNGLRLEHKTGFDLDFIAGYDFGLFRLEGELGWKRAGLDGVSVNPAVFVTAGRPAIAGRTQAVSAMANLLFDFGSNDGLQIYGGGGVGAARFNVEGRISGANAPANTGFDGEDRSFAWQLIAGARMPVSDYVDVGLKYRYFASEFDFSDPNGGGAAESLDGRFRSHSVLASLIFNLGSRAVPVLAAPAEAIVAAPQPPPPPATQTCPDGSVILASDACPTPPPPPPPPVAAPERG